MTEKRNCAACKHWTPPDSGDALWSENINYAGLGGCELTAVEGGAKGPGHLALAYDSSRQFAILATSPDFGCVQFEGK